MNRVEPLAGEAQEIEVFPASSDEILVRECHSDDLLDVRLKPTGQMIRRHGVAAGSASPVRFRRSPWVKYRHARSFALSSTAEGSTPVVLEEISDERMVEHAVASWHGTALSPSYWPSNQPDMEISSDTAAAQYPNWVFGLFKWALALACASLLLLALNFVFWGNPHLLAISAVMFGIAAALATVAFVRADREDRERSVR